MFDDLKKSVYATIGLALMARERIEEVGKKIASDAKLSETEGKNFVDELVKQAESARESLETTVAHQLEAVLGKLKLPSRGEIDELELRIRKLEAAQDRPPA